MDNPVDPNLPIERGKALHRQGRLDEAASVYRQVLADDQKNADALHLLGVIANQRGDYGKAAELIGAAVKHHPAAQHFHWP
jgi:Flp pilus assembly protein TadD